MAQIKKIPVTEKVCSRCGCLLPASAFTKDKKRGVGLRAECNECRKAFRKTTEQRVKATELKRAERARHPERNAIHANTYWYRHWPANRERQREYYKTHPEKAIESAGRHRARKLAALAEDVTKADVIVTFGTVCYCGQPIADHEMEIDHLIPLARGGQHVLENLRPAHKACNQSKGTKVVSYFEGLLASQSLEQVA